MSISKKEVLLSVKNYDFIQKLNEDQLKYLTKAVAFRTKIYKNFSELKIGFNEAIDSNLPDILRDNAFKRLELSIHFSKDKFIPLNKIRGFLCDLL